MPNIVHLFGLRSRIEIPTLLNIVKPISEDNKTPRADSFFVLLHFENSRESNIGTNYNIQFVRLL